MSSAKNDPAVRAILLSNLATLIVALVQGWPLSTLLWPYWIQSLVIGFFARRRMLALKNFSTEGVTSNGQPVPNNAEGKRMTANFFALHYGGFHLGYLVVLLSRDQPPMDRIDLLLLAALSGSFVYTHWQSHRRNLAADIAGKRNIGHLMVLPYARVVPMHLTVMFASGMTGIGLIFFTGLKTAADVLMHKVEHRWLQQPAAAKKSKTAD